MEIYKIFVKASVKILGFLIVKALFVDSHKLCRHIRAVFRRLFLFLFMEYLSHFIVLMAGGTILSLLLFVKKAFWA